MEVAKAATAFALEVSQSSKPMLFLNIGEPDFTAPARVQEAAMRAVRDGLSQYTPAAGMQTLREGISDWYRSRLNLDVPAYRIVITAGASAALHLACLALIEPGGEVLMPDPSYPCNRQFINAVGERAVLVPTGVDERFQLTARRVEEAWSPSTRGVMLASPSNPTGTSIAPDELRRIHEVVTKRVGGDCD